MNGKQKKCGYNNSHLFAGFLLLSALLHAAIFTMHENRQVSSTELSISSPLQVTIVARRQHVDKNQALTSPLIGRAPVTGQPLPETGVASMPAVGKPENTTRTNANIQADRLDEPRYPVLDNAKADKQNRHESIAAGEAPAAQDAQVNQLKKRLYSLIQGRFTYPRIARRMGWQGLVSLSLRIENDGSLNNVRVTRTSGHKILDDNAQKTIREIGTVNVAALQSFKAVSTNIEVLYRLTE